LDLRPVLANRAGRLSLLPFIVMGQEHSATVDGPQTPRGIDRELNIGDGGLCPADGPSASSQRERDENASRAFSVTSCGPESRRRARWRLLE